MIYSETWILRFWRDHLKWMWNHGKCKIKEMKIYVATEIKYTKLIPYYIKNVI
jgi:hypothetical protein